MSSVPSELLTGGVQNSVAEPSIGVGGGGGCCTVMLNAGSDTSSFDEFTVITIFEYRLASLAVGNPESAPVLRLNESHAGLFTMEKRGFPEYLPNSVGVKL